MSGCPSSGVFPACSTAHQHESWPWHPALLPAWFASITTAPFLPKTCLPFASLHISSCQVFGLEMTSPVSQTFLFYTLKSLWNLACLPKLSLSSLVTLLNIKHFYYIKPCWKGKRKKRKREERKSLHSMWRKQPALHSSVSHVFLFLLGIISLAHALGLLSVFLPEYLPHWKNPITVITKGVVSRLNWRVLEIGKPIPLLIMLHHFRKRNCFLGNLFSIILHFPVQLTQSLKSDICIFLCAFHSLF